MTRSNALATHRMGIGAWAWGARFWWAWGRDYGRDDVRAAFEVSLAAGVRLFDTAEVYGDGESERLLGAFAQAAPDDLLIATKCFPYPWRLTRGSLLSAARASLARLQRPSIELYQMHWPSPLVSAERWMRAMADAVEAGLVRQVGVSNYGLRDTEWAHRALEKRGLRLASNQIHYSLLRREAEHGGLLQLCQDLGVTVIAYSPLGQGLLTGKYGPDRRPGGVRRLRYSRAYLARAERLVTAMRKIGEKYGGRTPAQVAVNWCMAKGTLPIPGAKTAAQAQENVGALGWTLDAGDVAELDSLTA